jgi:hypothetical protein
LKTEREKHHFVELPGRKSYGKKKRRVASRYFFYPLHRQGLGQSLLQNDLTAFAQHDQNHGLNLYSKQAVLNQKIMRLSPLARLPGPTSS